MILLRGTDHIEELMLLLTRNLDRQSLRVNQKKVELWTIGELDEHRSRGIQAIFAKTGDNKNPKLVREFVDAYFKLGEEQIAETWNNGFPLLNRLLWANIESLPQVLFNRLLTRYTSPKYLLRAESEKLLRIHTLNTKRKRPIDLNRRLTNLGNTTYHNGFHYEAFAFAKQTKNARMIKVFSKRLNELEHKMDANRIST